MTTIYLKYKKKINISSIEDMELDKVYLNEYTYSAQMPESIKDEYNWQYLNITLDENETEHNIKNIDFRNLLPNGEYDLQYFVLKDNDTLNKVKINKVLLIIDDSNIPTSTTPTPTPTPEPGFPVSIILNNFSGLAENCSNYNGTYIVYDQSEYNYAVEPPNSYATDASVDVGYSQNNDNIYICLNITTPEGSSHLCQQYDINWSNGDYAIDIGGSFPSTPWCIGDISLEFSF